MRDTGLYLGLSYIGISLHSSLLVKSCEGFVDTIDKYFMLRYERKRGNIVYKRFERFATNLLTRLFGKNYHDLKSDAFFAIVIQIFSTVFDKVWKHGRPSNSMEDNFCYTSLRFS